jgi:hypothetical protein
MKRSALRETQRRRFYEDSAHPWHIEMVPKTLGDPPKPHPSWHCGVFVVHGIGSQTQAEVAAVLRSGFDEAWDAINESDPGNPKLVLPPPYVHDGWWANYADVEQTFPLDWKDFEDGQKSFFRKLWQQRTENALGTVLWFIKQQLRLLHWRTLRKLGPIAYVLYLFLQIVAPFILFVLYFRARELVQGFLADVRMYAEPKGVTERAIVQRIDARVADLFLKMIGLDREFRELDKKDYIKASGEPLCFDRVIWVAHSLGTVISYNVLSDLFHRARDLEANGDDRQKKGVALFRERLRRFVTLGSPLDKFAFLFENAVRPWPEVPRKELLGGGETIEGREDPEWWINYYHVLDPVSGSLSHPTITAKQSTPVNIHLRKLLSIPGAAHVAYWQDVDVLRYILGRTYGEEHLRDSEAVREKPLMNRVYAAVGMTIWTAIIVAAAWAIVFSAVPYLWGKLTGLVS